MKNDTANPLKSKENELDGSLKNSPQFLVAQNLALTDSQFPGFLQVVLGVQIRNSSTGSPPILDDASQIANSSLSYFHHDSLNSSPPCFTMVTMEMEKTVACVPCRSAKRKCEPFGTTGNCKRCNQRGIMYERPPHKKRGRKPRKLIF